jgi:homoserine O-succinyltransferase
MPIVIDGGRVPTRWAERKNSRLLAQGSAKESPCVRIAFINNMPDSALEDTEMQFFDLLDAASDDISVHVQLFSLPGVPRGERGQQHLENFYASTDELSNSRFDSVIITGTEPRQPNLRNEPYWSSLTKVLDWAEQNTVSAVLSCLAAHAGVLYSDGIERHPLGDKQFGIFAYQKVWDHALTSGLPARVQFPHSRWNELREDALTSCGYVVLTRSAEAGVDCFVKKKKKSLVVHLQGHPEYLAETLFKEYRRDIKRFMRGERETYPSMPQGYFDEASTKALADFRENAVHHRQEDSMASFPADLIACDLKNPWRASAKSLYRNWLQYVLARKAESPVFQSLARTGHQRSTTINNEVA